MNHYKQRFITYQENNLTQGLRFKQRALMRAMVEAHWYGRTLVVPKLIVIAKHNHGTALTVSWSKYRDLSQSTVTFSTASGNVELKTPTISEEELIKLNISEKDILRIPASHVVLPQENAKYRLIILDYKSKMSTMSTNISLPKAPMNPLLSQYQDVEFKEELIKLEFSDNVHNIAQQIKTLLPQPYCVVHLRSGDVEDGYLSIECTKMHVYANSMENVIAKIRNSKLQDHALYVMTNNKNIPKYIRPLYKKFKVFTYLDFQSLRALVDRTELRNADNYMLFTVEIALMEMASSAVIREKPDYAYSVRKPAAGKLIVALNVSVTPSLSARIKVLRARLKTARLRSMIKAQTRRLVPRSIIDIGKHILRQV